MGPAAKIGVLFLALLAAPAHANSCKIEAVPKTMGNVLMAGSAFFDLTSEKGTIAEMRVTTGPSLRARAAYTKDDKRVRFYKGVPLAVETLQSVASGRRSLGFYAEREPFQGNLRLADDPADHASTLTLSVWQIDDASAEVLVRYNETRPVSMALEDAVCVYQVLPDMIGKTKN